MCGICILFDVLGGWQHCLDDDSKVIALNTGAALPEQSWA